MFPKVIDVEKHAYALTYQSMKQDIMMTLKLSAFSFNTDVMRDKLILCSKNYYVASNKT